MIKSGDSTIWTELDFDRPGKQVGRLHLPYSVTRSAYGNIDIPIAVIANGSGPTVLLMAGNHGDEYEGQVTMVRLIRDLEPADLQGRVIIVPAANFLPRWPERACRRSTVATSTAPSRALPGTPTWQIAHYIDTVLVPKCDAWLDLHSGGSSLHYLPFAAYYQTGEDPALDAKAEGIMRAFGAPRSVRVTAAPDDRLAAASGHRRKIPYLGGEYGGTGSVDPDGVSITHGGTLRVLAHLGVLASKRFAVPQAAPTRLMGLGGHDYDVLAPEAGLFEPATRLGDAVRGGQLCGTVHFIDNPERPGVPVFFKRDGVVVCKRHFGRIEPGDCVAHLATDV